MAHDQSEECGVLGVSTIGSRKPLLDQLDNANQHDERWKEESEQEQIARVSAKILQELLEDSTFFDENPPQNLPNFSRDEIRVGVLLGKGEFGKVHEIHSFRNDVGGCGCTNACGSKNLLEIAPPPTEASSRTEEEISPQSTDKTLDMDDDVISELDEEELEESMMEDGEAEYLKQYMVNHVYRCRQFRYAMKRLKTDLPHERKLWAAIDLAREAKIMSCLHHTNIVHMRGTVGSMTDIDSFAIIMDRLNDTLREKITKWAAEVKNGKSSNRLIKLIRTFPTTHVSRRKKDELFFERLLALYDIARALRHLHEKHILFRDLKPENIGVNLRGDYRIFDFGLAKELKQKDLVEPPDGYQATGLTGSRRYMAPEVVFCKNYGFSADVYSFAILFWETLSLTSAYPKMSRDQHFEQVVLKGKRPRVLPELSKRLKKVMADGWSPNPSQRPTFETLCQDLLEEIRDMRETQHHTIENRTDYLKDKSHASRDDSVKECC